MSDRIIRAGSARHVQRWQPDSLRSDSAIAPAMINAVAPVTSLDESETLRRQAYEAGWQAGLAQGVEQGLAQGLSQTQAMAQPSAAEADRDALHALVAQWLQTDDDYRQSADAVLQELPALVSTLALTVARRVLQQDHDAIGKPGQALAALLEKALQPLQDRLRAQVSVHAHPDTLALLQQHLQAATWSALSSRCRPDPTQVPLGFVLRHEEGDIDLSLPTRWRQTVETFCSDPAALNWS